MSGSRSRLWRSESCRCDRCYPPDRASGWDELRASAGARSEPVPLRIRPGVRAGVARATETCRRGGSPRRQRSVVFLREEVDGDVDAVGVVVTGRGATGARVGPASADDGHVVGVALGRELAVGQDDRAAALLVLAPPV